MTAIRPNKATYDALIRRHDVLNRYLRVFGPSDTTLAPSIDEDILGTLVCFGAEVRLSLCWTELVILMVANGVDQRCIELVGGRLALVC